MEPFAAQRRQAGHASARAAGCCYSHPQAWLRKPGRRLRLAAPLAGTEGSGLSHLPWSSESRAKGKWQPEPLQRYREGGRDPQALGAQCGWRVRGRGWVGGGRGDLHRWVGSRRDCLLAGRVVAAHDEESGGSCGRRRRPRSAARPRLWRIAVSEHLLNGRLRVSQAGRQQRRPFTECPNDRKARDWTRRQTVAFPC